MGAYHPIVERGVNGGDAGGTCVIFNPTARGEKALRFRAFLESVGGDAQLRPTTGPGAARGLAKTAVESGFGRIIAAGGDGTAFEVLNGMLEVPGAFERSALGVLPLGTANVLAHELGVSPDPVRAWGQLLGAGARWLDAGHAEFLGAGGVRTSAWFAAVAGAGLDARAVEQVSWRWKKRVGKLAYVAAALRAFGWFPDRVRCVVNGATFEGRVLLAGNGRLYAGNIEVFEGGSMRSGRLRVMGVVRITPGVLVGCLQAWVTGRWGPGILRRGGGTTADVTEVRLESAGRAPAPLQLDGEFVGWLPAVLRVRPSAIRLLVPAGTAWAEGIQRDG